MVVMHKKTLRLYRLLYPGAAAALADWYEVVKTADWANFSELRQVLPATDLIGGDRYIFNIRGNHYRLLAAISFRTRTVHICGFFTHRQYDQLSRAQLLAGKWSPSIL